LPEPDKPYGSIRRYGEADVARVKFVKSAQRLGFSLDEVAGLLRLDDGAHCDEARARRAEARGCAGKLADLRRIESVLARLVHDCCASHGTVSCPLIVSLQGKRNCADSAR
jgi:MerR family mercuric resistance operon transcriptional regulator